MRSDTDTITERTETTKRDADTNTSAVTKTIAASADTTNVDGALPRLKPASRMR